MFLFLLFLNGLLLIALLRFLPLTESQISYSRPLMMILYNLERLIRISDIDEDNLPERISYKHILAPGWVNLYDSNCISLEIFPLLHEAVIGSLGLPVIHPELT